MGCSVCIRLDRPHCYCWARLVLLWRGATHAALQKAVMPCGSNQYDSRKATWRMVRLANSAAGPHSRITAAADGGLDGFSELITNNQHTSYVLLNVACTLHLHALLTYMPCAVHQHGLPCLLPQSQQFVDDLVWTKLQHAIKIAISHHVEDTS